jgi:hypothetical protein
MPRDTFVTGEQKYGHVGHAKQEHIDVYLPRFDTTI